MLGAALGFRNGAGWVASLFWQRRNTPAMVPESLDIRPKGRFAPSPTGRFHVGNLRTALASWLSAKSKGGAWIIRMEDVDTARSKPHWVEAQLLDLERLGLVSDEPVLFQSQSGERYQAALASLKQKGSLYACQCTRKELSMMASAPHLEDGLRPYSGRCRGQNLGEAGQASRFHLPADEIHWTDLVRGPQMDDPASLTGDPLLYRRDGCFAYHLAVVVDDAFQGVTEVVRGQDLQGVTATQMALQAALEVPSPRYAHLDLVKNRQGERLGKRHQSLCLDGLLGRGWRVEELLGWLGYTLGCLDRPEAAQASELVGLFDWAKVPDGQNQDRLEALAQVLEEVRY